MKKVLKYIFLYPIAYAYYKPKKTLKIALLLALCVCIGVFIFSAVSNDKVNEIPPFVTPAPTTANSEVTVESTALPTLTDTQEVYNPDAIPPSVYLPVLKDFDLPDFICDASFVYDINDEEFLYVDGHDTRVLPASTTKLLTILYARTLVPLDLKVSPGDELKLLGPNSSIAHLAVHHTLTVEQLIEGMLLPSGNDAAYVLAAAGGRAIDPNVKNGKEAVAVFMDGMNEYAESIGLTGSNFITPDGYDTEGHYSTVEDMAIIARLAYNDPVIRKYSAMVQDDVVFSSGHLITWKNTNSCINPYSMYYSPYINGLKTGTASSNYYCFIGSANINGREFVFGFFGETTLGDRFKDALIAVEWLKNSVLSQNKG